MGGHYHLAQSSTMEAAGLQGGKSTETPKCKDLWHGGAVPAPAAWLRTLSRGGSEIVAQGRHFPCKLPSHMAGSLVHLTPTREV